MNYKLKSVREVNEMIDKSTYGILRGQYVYARLNGQLVRIFRARTRQGVFQVNTSAGWVPSALEDIVIQ